ncbi:hypothetical protein [Evansella tamaricis]|uniref:Uncharacterized protein n=1 Tax=Evansella tamaricis TaxID=2069301 RepID=A0ABS6JEG6_9BACI|nr:hypothetical protein [Evansella tamaricis]MBU9711903.1 hypothetical protein [Evansella tamaricis]
MSRRTGRPNIGHATGRGVLPDGRIHYREVLAEEETVPPFTSSSKQRNSIK